MKKSLLLIFLTTLVLAGCGNLTTNCNEVDNTGYVFDVPSLMNKDFDEIKNSLPQNETVNFDEPTKLQLSAGVDEREGIINRDEYSLLITYNPVTKKVKDFFIDGTNEKELLNVGRLSNCATGYIISSVKAIVDPTKITGIVITQQ